jgi:hypothetical protein
VAMVVCRRAREWLQTVRTAAGPCSRVPRELASVAALFLYGARFYVSVSAQSSSKGYICII